MKAASASALGLGLSFAALARRGEASGGGGGEEQSAAGRAGRMGRKKKRATSQIIRWIKIERSRVTCNGDVSLVITQTVSQRTV